jgi:hypothetical protein
MRAEDGIKMARAIKQDDQLTGSLKRACLAVGVRDLRAIENEWRGCGAPADVNRFLVELHARSPRLFLFDAAKRLAELRPAAPAARSARPSVREMTPGQFAAECRRRGLRPPRGG